MNLALEPNPKHKPRYPLRRTFVVQLVSEEQAQAPFTGRIEHVSSGSAIEFASAEALLRFIEAILGQRRESLPD